MSEPILNEDQRDALQEVANLAMGQAATRLARHTLGPKQKSTIHGSVSTPEPATTAAVVTPPVTK